MSFSKILQVQRLYIGSNKNRGTLEYQINGRGPNILFVYFCSFGRISGNLISGGDLN